MKTETQPVRAGFHSSMGVVALLLAHVGSLGLEASTGAITQVTGYLALGEILKLFAYHFLIKPGARWARVLKASFWQGRKKWYAKAVCVPIFLIAWFLRGLHWLLVEKFFVSVRMIRKSDIPLYSAMFPFAVGIFVPLYWGGVTPAAVALAVAIHGFGDPMARIFGVEWGEKRIYRKVKKTWVGFSGFMVGGLVGGMISIILNCWYPIHESSWTALLAISLALPLGAFLEFIGAPVNLFVRKWTGWAKYLGYVVTFFVEDNFLVSCVLAFFIGWIL